MTQKIPRTFLYCLGALFLLNLIQGYFTELIFDEAYYWHYAQNMAWGYFDHPPMVALLVKISSFFFEGELGVRFMSCVLSVATFVVLWGLIEHAEKRKYIFHFFILGLSMTLLNAYGFLTLPDTPLLFFTALFLWVYKKFIAHPSIPVTLLLGLVMACLMYSKYHAVLVIVFVLASNLKLLINKYAWLAVFVALICYIPHFIWLFDNDFVSIKYHLFERPNRAYEFEDFTLGFFINLVALFGLTFPLIYYALFKTRAKDTYTRALLFLTYGVLLFFFVSSFNRRVQTQWIIVVCIPIFILVYHYMLDNVGVRKWIFRLGIANLIILCYLRLWIIHQPLLPLVYESHGNKEWVTNLQSQIGDIPVVFENSYRNTPMYSFYSGNPTYSLNNIHYRKNQYSIDSSEFKVQHQKVLYVSKYVKQGDVSYKNGKGTQYYGSYIANFESFRKLHCFLDEDELAYNTAQEVVLKVYNPYSKNIPLEKIKFSIAYTNRYKQVQEVLPLKAAVKDENIVTLVAQDTTYFNFNLPKSSLEEPGYFKISISENGLYTGLNGQNIKLK